MNIPRWLQLFSEIIFPVIMPLLAILFLVYSGTLVGLFLPGIPEIQLSKLEFFSFWLAGIWLVALMSSS